MRIRLRGIVLALLVASLPGIAAAQSALSPPGDRGEGEEEQILRRIEWFVQQRGLDRISRADLLRRDAVSVMKDNIESNPNPVELSWQPLGPESMTMFDWAMGKVSGRVSSLAIHPTDEDTIFLGSASGGLWKTIDGGSSWRPVFDQVGTQTIGSVFIDPAAPDTVWVGTGEQGQSCWSYFGMGLFKSTDGGDNFVAMNGSGSNALDLSFITAIVVHPTDPDIVLVAGETWCDDGDWLYGGLYRSTDGGISWSKVLSGAVTDLVVDPEPPHAMFSAVGRWSQATNGIYRSTDAGTTWTQITSGLPNGSSVGRSRLVMAPSDNQKLYALMNGSSSVELYRSIDGGTTWTLTNNDACDGQCWYNLCLAVHPDRPEELLVGTIRFYHSTDAGATLTSFIDGWGSSQKVHQDIHVLRWSNTDPDRFWVAGDGGIWRTDDHGANFINLNANLNITQYYDIAVHPGDRATVFGGAQDNSSSRTAGDTLWDATVVTGDGFINIVDPAQPQTVIQTSYPWDGRPSLYLSRNGGSPNSFSYLWLIGVTQYEPWPWVTPLVEIDLGAATPTHLFMASDHVYRSTTENPDRWAKISGDLTGSSGSVSVLAPIRYGDTVRVYAGTSNGQIHRSDDVLEQSPAWIDVTGNYPGDTVTDIAVDPVDPSLVYATRGAFGNSRLYRSLTGGTTWEAVGGNLPNLPANTVAIDPYDTSRVFVGTDIGAFLSIDRGQSFWPMMAGLPLGVVVTDLEIDGQPYVLTAGTYGRGAWQVELGEGPIFVDGFESGDSSEWSTAVP